MTTGRNNKIVGATGEYLVAAELSRRGFIATTFTGNVPHYDIIASNETGHHVSVQVKASRGPKWQFGNIALYCDIAFNGDQQVIGKKKSCPVRGLIVVFVRIDSARNDRFFILQWDVLRDILVEHHKAYLIKHGGSRPKKWASLHCAIPESDLAPFEDKWDTILQGLR